MITTLRTRENQLVPWAGPPARIPGWLAITESRKAAADVAAIAGGTVTSEQEGQWQARIPKARIDATAVTADTRSLRCRIGDGIFILEFTPWPQSAVITIPPDDMPATGKLTVRAVLMTTRMRRTVRFLLPEFTAT